MVRAEAEHAGLGGLAHEAAVAGLVAQEAEQAGALDEAERQVEPLEALLADRVRQPPERVRRRHRLRLVAPPRRRRRRRRRTPALLVVRRQPRAQRLHRPAPRVRRRRRRRRRRRAVGAAAGRAVAGEPLVRQPPGPLLPGQVDRLLEVADGDLVARGDGAEGVQGHGLGRLVVVEEGVRDAAVRYFR